MADNVSNMTLKPIGFVRSEITEPVHREFKDVIAEIVIDSSLTQALDNLDEFSHIIVLYWMHLSNRKPPLKIHPRGKQDLPLMGLFATRSPHRPNPIGKTTVRLLERHGNVLKVQGLDAIDGTPVIDIKPYQPHNDSVENARVPPWVNLH